MVSGLALVGLSAGSWVHGALAKAEVGLDQMRPWLAGPFLVGKRLRQPELLESLEKTVAVGSAGELVSEAWLQWGAEEILVVLILELGLPILGVLSINKTLGWAFSTFFFLVSFPPGGHAVRQGSSWDFLFENRGWELRPWFENRSWGCANKAKSLIFTASVVLSWAF
ncbi:unnamed protein product [Prunus armeniaca]